MFSYRPVNVLFRILVFLAVNSFAAMSMAGNETVEEMLLHSAMHESQKDEKSLQSYWLLENGDFQAVKLQLLRAGEDGKKYICYSIQKNQAFRQYMSQPKAKMAEICIDFTIAPEYVWIVFETAKIVKGIKKRHYRIERWNAQDLISGCLEEKRKDLRQCQKNYEVCSAEVISELPPHILSVSKSGKEAILVLNGMEDYSGSYLYANDRLTRLPEKYQGAYNGMRECCTRYQYNLDFFPYIYCFPNPKYNGNPPWNVPAATRHSILKLDEDGSYHSVDLSNNPYEYYKAWCETMHGPEYEVKDIEEDFDKSSSPDGYSFKELCEAASGLKLQEVRVYENGERLLFKYFNPTSNTDWFFDINDDSKDCWAGEKQDEVCHSGKHYFYAEGQPFDLERSFFCHRKSKESITLGAFLKKLDIKLASHERISWFSHVASEGDALISGTYVFMVFNIRIGMPPRIIKIECNDYLSFTNGKLSIKDVTNLGEVIGEITLPTSSQPLDVAKCFSYDAHNMREHIPGLRWCAVSILTIYRAGTLTSTGSTENPNEQMNPYDKGKEKVKEGEFNEEASTSVGLLSTPKGNIQLDPIPYARSCSLNGMSHDASIACGESTFPDIDSYKAYLCKRQKLSDSCQEPSCLPNLPNEEQPTSGPLLSTGLNIRNGVLPNTCESSGSKKRKRDEKGKEKELEHGEDQTNDQVDERAHFKGSTQACVWLLSSKDSSLENIEAIELEVPEGCTFSTAIKCVADGHKILGQYLVPSSTGEYRGCVWERDNDGKFHFRSLEIEGDYNYVIPMGISGDGWTSVIVGQSGTVNTTLCEDYLNIDGYPTIWINEVPSLLQMRTEAGAHVQVKGIAKYIARPSGMVLGNYGGKYKHSSTGEVSSFGGRAFVAFNPKEGIIDLKEWMTNHHKHLADELQDYELIDVDAVSRDGETIVVRGLFEGKEHHFVIDLSNGKVSVPQLPG